MIKVLMFDWKDFSAEAEEEIVAAVRELGLHAHSVETHSDCYGLVLSNEPLSAEAALAAWEDGWDT